MKKKARVRQRHSWETADYKFAVATLILFTFFLFAGIASWLTSDKPTAAAELNGYPFRSTIAPSSMASKRTTINSAMNTANRPQEGNYRPQDTTGGYLKLQGSRAAIGPSPNRNESPARTTSTVRRPSCKLVVLLPKS
jgi:hypothetical protein